MKRALTILFVAVTAVAFGQTDRDVFRDAETRFRNQDYELALDRYEALIREYPLSDLIPDAQYRRAVTLYRLQRYEESIELFERIERRFRSTEFLELVPFWQGVVRYYLRDYETSVRRLDAFLTGAGAGDGSFFDLVDEAHLYKALSSVALGRDADAVGALEAIFDYMGGDSGFRSEDSYALALLLSLYDGQGRSESVLELVAGVDFEAVNTPWRSQVRLFVAEALWRLERSEEAILEYEALYDAPVEVASVAFQRRFQIASERGEDTAEIVARAEQRLVARTDILRAFWLRVGLESFTEGRFELAELYLRRIWDLRSGESIGGIVPVYLAELYRRRGDVARAVGILESGLELGLDQRDQMLYRLGAIRLQEGDFVAAFSTLETFLGENPDSPFFAEAAYQRAYALYRANELEQALGQIASVRAASRGGRLREEFIRLEATALRRLGRTEAAAETLYEYTLARPTDISAVSEYLKLLFLLERYGEIITTGTEALARPAVGENPVSAAEISYLVGLSMVAQGRYRDALEVLDDAAAPQLDVTTEELAIMRPYRLFYRGWSHYRLGEFQPAVDAFVRLLQESREHPLAPRAAYLAGWSAFSMAQYDRATSFLEEARGLAGEGEVAVEAGFLLGQTHRANGNGAAALTAFRGVFLDFPSSDLAPEARFEYADILAEEGRTDAAADEFAAIHESYRGVSIAENALYRRAEVLFDAAEAAEARNAFFDYRTTYPDGAFYDNALYFGGLASLEAGEAAGALLLWEQLIDEYRRSPFRSEAMLRSAQIYRERGEYRSALRLINQLIASYPEEAQAVGAERTADQLGLLLRGLSEREAELWVTIDENDGAATEDGRQAIIELGRLLIYEGTGAALEDSLIVPSLREVAAAADDDPAAASQAQFLIAEYHARRAQNLPGTASARDAYLSAAEAFVEAATLSRADPDLTALSLFRAAETYKAAGRSQEMEVLIEEITDRFPESEWALQARRLREGTE